jgi:hypothetical protein
MAEFVVCAKCQSKWETGRLERKGVAYCELCSEPGLRYMDANGTPTDETFPRDKEAG